MIEFEDFLMLVVAGIIISFSVLAIMIMADLLEINLPCNHETGRKYREASAEATKLQSRLSEMEAELSAAKTQLHESSGRRDETCKALEAAQKGQQDAVEKLARERVAYGSACKELGSLRNTLNLTLDELGSTHKTIESQATALKNLEVEVDRLQSCLDASEEQRKQDDFMHQAWVRHSLSNSSTTMAEMRNLQEQVTSIRQRCEVWYSMYKTTHRTMEGQVADMSTAINQAQSKNRELDSLNEDLKRKNKELKAMNMSLEDDNASLRDGKWWLEEEFQKLSTELAAVKENNQKLVIKWWKALSRDDCAKSQRDAETEAITAMFDSQLNTTTEMDWDIATVVGVREEQEQEADNEEEDDEQEGEDEGESDDDDDDNDDDCDDMECQEGDDEDDVESLDGSEASEAYEVRETSVSVQTYSGGSQDGDDDESDENEYEYEYEYEYVDRANCGVAQMIPLLV